MSSGEPSLQYAFEAPGAREWVAKADQYDAEGTLLDHLAELRREAIEIFDMENEPFEQVQNSPLPVLGKLAEKLVVRRNEREIEVAIQSIKDHCEG